MELWIRSQDKKRLIKTNILELSIYEPNNLVLTEEDIGKENCKIFANEHIYIGTYKSKERALEVLDEIQRILIPKGIIKFDSLLNQEDIETLRKHFDNNYTVVNKNVELLQPFETLVYEMPKE